MKRKKRLYNERETLNEAGKEFSVRCSRTIKRLVKEAMKAGYDTHDACFVISSTASFEFCMARLHEQVE